MKKYFSLLVLLFLIGCTTSTKEFIATKEMVNLVSVEYLNPDNFGQGVLNEKYDETTWKAFCEAQKDPRNHKKFPYGAEAYKIVLNVNLELPDNTEVYCGYYINGELVKAPENALLNDLPIALNSENNGLVEVRGWFYPIDMRNDNFVGICCKAQNENQRIYTETYDFCEAKTLLAKCHT